MIVNSKINWIVPCKCFFKVFNWDNNNKTIRLSDNRGWLNNNNKTREVVAAQLAERSLLIPEGPWFESSHRQNLYWTLVYSVLNKHIWSSQHIIYHLLITSDETFTKIMLEAPMMSLTLQAIIMWNAAMMWQPTKYQLAPPMALYKQQWWHKQ